MKRLLLIIAVVFGCVSLAFAQAEKSEKAKANSKASGTTNEAKLVAPDQLTWSPFFPGIERAVVLGDPGRTGQFVVRLRATDDAKIPPHWHPTDELVTVLEGEAALGMGKKWDDAQLKSAPVHGAALMPAKMPHYAQFKKGALVQVNGNGPFVINFVNKEDDPNKAKK
jgi:quercetin dioxygenase-like cupin family protein